MLSNRLAVAIVGGACILAAGAGAFVATRQKPATMVASEAVTSPAPVSAPVHETEAVMEPSAAVVPAAKPARLADTVSPAPERPARSRTASPPAERRPAPAPARPPERREQPRPEMTAASRPAPAQAPGRPTEGSDEASVPPAPHRVEPAQASPPPAPAFDEVTIPADSVIGLQIDNTVSSETAQVEDAVEARVSRDVLADGRVAVPAGARALGNVTVVEQGGKFKERARLALRFHTLVLADGTTIPIQTDTVYRDGESPSRSSATKIGIGTAAGTIAGAIFGGGKGAVIGGAVGAAGGTAATMAGSRHAATLPAGSTITVRVLSPVDVTVER
jgi:type IV secretory pathway VirB10-like protein